MQIVLQDIYFSYDRKTINYQLNNINTSIKESKVTSLIGATGAGKSTLIKHLNGLLIPNSGKIIVDDYSIDVTIPYKKSGKINYHLLKKKRKDIKELRKKVAIVFQFPESQIFEETVIKEVSYGLINYGMSKQDAILKSKKTLEKLGLDESYLNRSPLSLSGGEKRRVALASILSLPFDILILDEPTIGLDKLGKDILYEIINELKNEGNKTIILSTHDMDFLLKVSDDVILFDDGKIIKQDNPINIFNDSELIKTYSIEPPKCFEFTKKLISNNFNIDLKNVKDIDSLIENIKAQYE